MTIQLVTRAQWGAQPREVGTTSIAPEGVVIHWEGGGWSWPWPHSTCDDKVRAMQEDHMHGTHNWSDIAYNYLACPHRYVFEGRGYDRRSSANGDSDVNYKYFAVQCMWGTKGGHVPDDLKSAARDAIDYLRIHGHAGSKILGHRDTNETDCPGDELYAWVKLGAPRPGLGDMGEMELTDQVGNLKDLDGSPTTVQDVLYRANWNYYSSIGKRAEYEAANPSVYPKK